MNNRIIWLAILLLAGTSACTSTPEEPETAAAESIPHEPRLLAPVKVEDRDPVRCQGYIEAPPQGRHSVRVPVAGFVTRILPLPGQLVRKGELLAELTHPDYIHLQQQYLEIKAELAFQTAALGRQETLRGQSATTEREYTRALADQQIGQSRLAAMKAELALLGIQADRLEASKLQSSIRILSPETGYVTAVGVAMGELAGPQQELCEVVVLKHLHVEASVFEQDRQKVVAGQKITFQVAGSETQYRGEVLLVGHQVELDGRAVKIHIEPETEQGLVPGAFASVLIETEPVVGWMIPQEAVYDGVYGPEVHVHRPQATALVVPLSGFRRTTTGYFFPELPAGISETAQLEAKGEAGGGHDH